MDLKFLKGQKMKIVKVDMPKEINMLTILGIWWAIQTLSLREWVCVIGFWSEGEGRRKGLGPNRPRFQSPLRYLHDDWGKPIKHYSLDFFIWKCSKQCPPSQMWCVNKFIYVEEVNSSWVFNAYGFPFPLIMDKACLQLNSYKKS